MTPGGNVWSVDTWMGIVANLPLCSWFDARYTPKSCHIVAHTALVSRIVFFFSLDESSRQRGASLRGVGSIIRKLYHLYIERGFFGVRLDERLARWHIGAHEHVEDLVGFLRVFDGD